MKDIVGEEVLSSALPKIQELVSRVDRLCNFDFKVMLRTILFSL
jgi:hypothetical protein